LLGAMNIKAYLNPNPYFKDKPLIDPWGREYKMKNVPFVEIEIYKPKEKRFKLKLMEPFPFEKEIKTSSNKISVIFPDKKFANPEISYIRIKIEGKRFKEEIELPLKVHKIEGVARDTKGNPLRVYLWAAGYKFRDYEYISKADKNGKFRFYYPAEKKFRLFICDRKYAKKHLECWFITEGLRNDVRINPVIGNFELWEHKAWINYDIWNVFFSPAIVDREIPPEIEKSDVKVFINGKRAEIKKFTPHQIYFKGEKRGIYYPAYILSGTSKELIKENIDKFLFKIIIKSEKKKIYGEGWYLVYTY